VIPRKNLAWDHYSGIRASILQTCGEIGACRGTGELLWVGGRKTIVKQRQKWKGQEDDHEPQGLALLVVEFGKFQTKHEPHRKHIGPTVG
jgi:hypothetical protein